MHQSAQNDMKIHIRIDWKKEYSPSNPLNQNDRMYVIKQITEAVVYGMEYGKKCEWIRDSKSKTKNVRESEYE